MKTKLIPFIAAVAFLPLAGFAQTMPVPPAPPAPPNPPGHSEHREKQPKVPVTFLGVDTSEVPRVVSEQLGLAKGFGLVVDYLAPDGPAAAAGVQQNDILKMLNDQILTEPAQLAKLVRSYNEGTTITLTLLRKGQEQKVSVKLTKKEIPQRRAWGPEKGRRFGDQDFGDLGEELGDLLGEGSNEMIQEAVMTAHEEVAEAREEALQAGQRIRDQAQRVRDEAQRMRDKIQRERDSYQRARDEARASGMIKITKTDDTGLKTTNIDISKAQIVFSDDKGELRIDHASGKKILTAKDPQGRLLFSGPAETKEELDKVPAEVRDRFVKLQENDLPSVISAEIADEEEEEVEELEADEEESDGPVIERASMETYPYSWWTFRTVLI
jgi:membrane-associated protease RseP (regulator of RpoE activity)